MSIKTFLENSNNNALKVTNPRKIGDFNDRIEILSFLNLATKSSENADSTLLFLEQNIDEIDNEINDVLESVDLKISLLLSTIEHINRFSYEPSSTSNSSDISIVNLTKGEFENMSYSISDLGLTMEIVNMTEFGE